MNYPTCKECGSDRVWSDAVAFYDDLSQSWNKAEANEVHFGCNQCNHDDVGIEWKPLKKVYSYKNSSSESGLSQLYYLRPSNVDYARVWTNSFGNPTTCLHMKGGDTHMLVDEYGAMNGLPNVSLTAVHRRKDLF